MPKEPTLQDYQRQIAASNAAAARYNAQAAKIQKDIIDIRKDIAGINAETADIKKSIAKLRKDFGDFGNTLGKDLENAVVDYLWDTRLLCGIRVDNLYPDVKSALPECQYDAVVANGKYLVVVEAKRTLTIKSVREFVDRQLPLFGEVFPAMTKGKKVLGAMVYQRTNYDGKAVRAALDAGLYVLCARSNKELRQIKSAGEITERQKP